MDTFPRVLGPFTRPHPAIWRMVFGESFLLCSLISSSVDLAYNLWFIGFFFVRSQCPLLPLPGVPHLPEPGSGEDADVLAGSQSTLRHTRSRYHGEQISQISSYYFYVINNKTLGNYYSSTKSTWASLAVFFIIFYHAWVHRYFPPWILGFH